MFVLICRYLYYLLNTFGLTQISVSKMMINMYILVILRFRLYTMNFSRVTHIFMVYTSLYASVYTKRIQVTNGIIPWFYPTALRRVQITPKTSTNITQYLYSRGPVRQVCLVLLLLTNQLAGFPRQFRSASHTSVTYSP